MKVRICHLYGNLLNTYGDNGNLLMLQYVAREMGHEVETTIVSLKEPFIASDYDVVFIGGGRDTGEKGISISVKTASRWSLPRIFCLSVKNS